MGDFDIFCTVCGGPYVLWGENDKKHNKLKYKWMQHIFLIGHTETKYKTNHSKLGGNVTFIINNSEFAIQPYTWKKGREEDYFDYGISCHQVCYFLLLKKLKYKLKFADVCRMLENNNGYLKQKSIYGPMKKYTGRQEIYWNDITDRNKWMFLNPYTN